MQELGLGARGLGKSAVVAWEGVSMKRFRGLGFQGSGASPVRKAMGSTMLTRLGP